LIFREVEDRDLIAKARQGDVEAYNLLVSRWEKRIFNYLLRLVSNREDALDISQETFLKAYQNLRKLDDPARFSAWLFRIAHNEAFSLLRRRKPESELSEPRPRDFGGRLLPIELSLAIESALKVLSEDQREAVLLKVYQGFKFDEMAEILEIPVSTVKSRLYTALDLLKATLAPAVFRKGGGMALCVASWKIAGPIGSRTHWVNWTPARGRKRRATSLRVPIARTSWPGCV
jgi:RNA polymerase sigma-70 factor, ECF subfamily